MYRHKLVVLCIAAALLLLVFLSASAHGPAGPQAPSALPRSYLTNLHSSTHFTIYGTTDCTQHAADCLLGAYQAQRVADNLEIAWGIIHQANFNALKNHYDVAVYDMDPGYLGWCCDDYFHIDAYQVHYSDNDTNLAIDTETIPAHELFHDVQNRSGDGAWATEGTSSWVEDSIFTDADHYSGCSFVEDMAGYLSRPNAASSNASKVPSGLNEADYSAGIWWKYAGERCGQVQTNPQTGIDLVREFWDGTSKISIDAMEDTLAAVCGSSMKQMFPDFAVANYTKTLSKTGLAARYYYADEQEGGQTYPSVAISTTVSLAAGATQSYTNQQLAKWGVVYHRAKPASGCTFLQVAFTGSPTGIAQSYAVEAVRSNALVSDSRANGDEHTVTIYNSPQLAEVAAIAIGLAKTGSYDLVFKCVSPSLNIVEPLQSQPAQAGAPGSPRPVMVRVTVTGPAGEFVEGLAKEAFTIQVDSQNATIVSSAYVMKEYWLVIKLPSGLSSGLHNLAVSIGGASDTEPQSISLSGDKHFNEVLIVDRSWSMDYPTTYPKITAARNAARLFTAEVADGDRLGLVSFSSSASADYHPATVTDQVRTSVKTSINNLVVAGATALGTGLLQALTETVSYGSASYPDVLILMSDGEENVRPCWKSHPGGGVPDCDTGPYVADIIKQSGVKVHTVALGPDADQALMQEIATATGGKYRYNPAPSTLRTGAAAVPDDWAVLLPDIYEFIQGTIAGQVRLDQATVVRPYGTPYGREIYLDDGLDQVTFSVAEETARSTACDGFKWKMYVRRPDGTLIDPSGSLPAGVIYRDDRNSGMLQVPDPEQGWWILGVENWWQICRQAAEPALTDARFRIMVSGVADLKAHLYLTEDTANRQVGTPMPILGMLLGHDGLVAADMTAEVTDPADTTFTLPLHDDGRHDDGAAGDGVYGGLFAQTNSAGSYAVQLIARREMLVRRDFSDFYIQADEDRDDDGMPDDWERRHGLNPENPADAEGDPDQDGLINLEEYRWGTNPRNDDSDSGGENDLSEVRDGLNPTDPADDRVQPPAAFWVEPRNGFNLLHFSVWEGITDLELLISTDPAFGAFEHRLIAPTGFYEHFGLPNGVRFYYRLAARGQQGESHRTSGFTDVAFGVPQEDPDPPLGVLRINGGARRTSSRHVIVTLDASPDSAQMRVADGPTFAGAEWRPFAPEFDWQINVTDGRGRLYVQLMDHAGNLSRTLTDSIEVGAGTYLPLVLRKH